MKKNSQLHLRIETDIANKIREQSERENISIGELIRKKLRWSARLDRIETLLEELLQRRKL